jgi:hypothetical protein
MCKASVICLRDCATVEVTRYLVPPPNHWCVQAKPTGRDAGMFAYWHPRENLVSEIVCVRFRRHVVSAYASFLDSFMSQFASAGRVARTCRLHTSRSSRSQGRARPSITHGRRRRDAHVDAANGAAIKSSRRPERRSTTRTARIPIGLEVHWRVCSHVFSCYHCTRCTRLRNGAPFFVQPR